VTAGPNYDPSTHQDVPVNGHDSICIDSDLVTCWLKVRIKDYHGLPHDSPASSPYFEHKLHTSDRYSIAFSFVPKRDFSGSDLVIGFDYDHSIKHQLPPGFKYAMKIATSMLDPGLYSDPYSDNPYLYGPALSGLFTLNIGERVDETPAKDQLASLEQATGGVVEEGATGTGNSVRESLNLPSKWKKRRKHFLDPQALSDFTFEKRRMYHADFFNPHLDFANFSLRLPGFSISVAKYIDEKTHHLRYVLKNRSTDEVLFVVFFKLLFGEELEKVNAEKKSEQMEGRGKVGRNDARDEGKQDAADVPDVGDRSEQSSNVSVKPGKLDAIETEKPEARVPQSTEEGPDDDGDSSYSATAAVTALSNSIYAAIAAMGMWNDTSSSSDSEPQSRDTSPGPSNSALQQGVDDMDDATVEKFLQSRQSNVG